MNSPVAGSLSYRPRITAAECAINFVYSHLPHWRDHPDRRIIESENELTESLTNYLADEARRGNQPFTFSNQPSAGGRRTVDFSARLYDEMLNTFALPALTVFEAKRLPTPGSQREKEYVIGLEKSYGGIQRFKLGKQGHGSGFQLVAMIGYIQKDTPDLWLNTINSWIVELAENTSEGSISWEQSETLAKLKKDKKAHTARAISTHSRYAESNITIRHLWIIMNTKPHPTNG